MKKGQVPSAKEYFIEETVKFNDEFKRHHIAEALKENDENGRYLRHIVKTMESYAQEVQKAKEVDLEDAFKWFHSGVWRGNKLEPNPTFKDLAKQYLSTTKTNEK